jgi:hypothetical protein
MALPCPYKFPIRLYNRGVKVDTSRDYEGKWYCCIVDSDGFSVSIISPSFVYKTEALIWMRDNCRGYFSY